MTIETNEAKLYKHRFKFIHIINLDDFRDNIELIQNNIRTLNENQHMSAACVILNIKLKELENTFNFIYPYYRNKRALLNILGSGIKFITGNMDHEDAKEINTNIQNLKFNVQNLNTDHNKQVKINENIIDRLKFITNHINHQQLNITQQIKDLGKNFNNILWASQFVYQISFNIDILKDHFEDLADSISMARLNILSKNIINKEEREFIELKLTSQNIEITSAEQALEHLNIQAYYNHTQLIFVLNIPIYDATNFTEYTIIPLINKKNQTILVPFERILINHNETFFIVTPCYTINKIKYCSLNNLKNINQDNCFKNILRNTNATCNYIKGHKYTEIIQISNNILIIKNARNLYINTNCKFNRNVTGNFFIRINECKIEINGIIYENLNKIYKQEINQLLHGIYIKEEFETTLNLETLHDKQIDNIKTIQDLRKETIIHNTTHYTLTFIIIIIIATIVTYIIRKYTFEIIQRSSSESQLKEGGVMSQHNTPPILITLPRDVST